MINCFRKQNTGYAIKLSPGNDLTPLSQEKRKTAYNNPKSLMYIIEDLS